MKKKIFKCFILAIAVCTAFTSCRKDEFVDDDNLLKDGGKTIVKIANGPKNEIFFSPFTDIRTVELVDLRRDANSNASLNTELNVTLTANPAAIAKYNTDMSENFEALPESIYTLDAPKFTKTATGFKVNFAPGELANLLKIKLNGALYDLTKKYALAFDITESGVATTTATPQKSILILISIKNKYDGVYEITGSLTDANGLYKGDYGDPAGARTYSLTTASATAVNWYDISWDYTNYIVVSIATGGGANSGIRPFITFDPVTDKITSITDANSATRVFTNVTGQYNNADKSIDLTWTSGRWSVSEHYTFLRDR